MILYFVLAVVLGICAGIITGLIPGLHINLVAMIVLSTSVFLLQYFSPLVLAAFIISMSITHTFLDFVPSCYLGAPDGEDNALSVLPAHRLLLEGRGYEAVRLTAIGSLGGLIAILILTPILLFSVARFYSAIENYIAYILIFASLFLILKDDKKLWALISYLMAGVFGVGVFSLVNLKEPLFPMLSGLFGTSGLILSIKTKTKIPQQNLELDKINKKEFGKVIGSGVAASTLVGFFPGIGSAQAAILVSSVFKRISTRGFLMLLGSISTIVMVISIIALYTIEKSRNGAILVVSKILEEFSLNNLFLFLGISLIVGVVAFFITLKVAKWFSKFMSRVNYKRVCLSIIIFITVLVIIISGLLGLFVLVVATFIGMVPTLRGVGRNHLMGCLILPVILYFLL